MRKSLSFLLSVIIVLSCLTVFANADSFEYTSVACDEEWAVLKMINEYRAENGKQAVSMTVSLQDAAGIRSAELLSSLSHYRPDSSAWYSVLDEKGIEYNSESYEIIAANISSPESLLKALSASQLNSERLLSDNLHIGIGYIEADDTPNSSAYCIIGVSCGDEAEAELCDYEIPHLTYGEGTDNIGLVIRRSCSHGKGYLQVISSMIGGYDPESMGTNTLTVDYEGTSLPFDIVTDYLDCAPGAWYYDAVLGCTDNGYFSGTGKGKFGVKTQMTREMFVTVLGRFAGIDTEQYKGTSFEDVEADKWYSPYVEWASQGGVVNGDGKGRFNGGKPITRQEICVILCNFIDKYEINAEQVNASIEFADADAIASWALDSVTKCQTVGIVSGNNKGEFMPLNNASRAEVAVMFSNFDRVVNS